MPPPGKVKREIIKARWASRPERLRPNRPAHNTAMPLIRKHPNLLVVETLSKCRALAGLRVGYAIGDQALIG